MMRELAYRCALYGYSSMRRCKNRMANLLERPVVVLVYHRVADLPSDPQMVAVTPENFRAQMRHLKSAFPILRFEEDWSQAAKPAVVITFDDGYADNAWHALPILEELEIPATFFVSTGSIGTSRQFWWYDLERMILHQEDLPERFVLDDDGTSRAWRSATLPERKALYHDIHLRMLTMAPQRRERWLCQLRRWSGRDAMQSETDRVMNLPELRLLAGSRWATVGAHTVTHSSLSALAIEEQRQEIVTSKRQLEAWLGRKVEVFSYPYGGKRDYTGETMALCREAGFVKVAANYPGQAHRWTDPYQIPRQVVRDWDGTTFAGMMKRFLTA